MLGREFPEREQNMGGLAAVRRGREGTTRGAGPEGAGPGSDVTARAAQPKGRAEAQEPDTAEEPGRLVLSFPPSLC